MRPSVADLLSPDPDRVERAVDSLAKRGDRGDIIELLQLVVGPNTSAMFNALRVLPVYGEDARICRFLAERLQNGSQPIRERAAFALKDLPQLKAMPDLERCAARDKNEAVRIWALHALSSLGMKHPRLTRNASRFFVRAIRSRSPGVRQAGFECLSLVRAPSSKRLIERAMRDPAAIVRLSAPGWKERVDAWKRVR